jgi:hypothetical protein
VGDWSPEPNIRRSPWTATSTPQWPVRIVPSSSSCSNVLFAPHSTSGVGSLRNLYQQWRHLARRPPARARCALAPVTPPVRASAPGVPPPRAPLLARPSVCAFGAFRARCFPLRTHRNTLNFAWVMRRFAHRTPFLCRALGRASTF